MSENLPAQMVFDYLRENLRIGIDCSSSWGYYENGEVNVTVSLYLRNPETGVEELISSDSSTAH